MVCPRKAPHKHALLQVQGCCLPCPPPLVSTLCSLGSGSRAIATITDTQILGTKSQVTECLPSTVSARPGGPERLTPGCPQQARREGVQAGTLEILTFQVLGSWVLLILNYFPQIQKR